ncbi:hypothetical protein C8N43_2459 [Litoreibacter ponti]|uniref:Uncharacterized protein n=1 Tax=Litoreibacter ponti TaxID=1510457 RepID=A0A2T6BP71_9RHOB|nr:hypothetical protein [Litoreibacter ponti]PTX57787.1 hypothetical protein C8N43_2459 [Litoreibacter ponti]
MNRQLRAAALAAGLLASSQASAEGIVAAIVPAGPSEHLASPVLPDTVRLPTLPSVAKVAPEASAVVPVAEIVGRQANISNFGTTCGPSLTVLPSENAMLRVEIQAPCEPSQYVDVTHHGLSFTTALSMTGKAEFMLPALTPQAQVSVRLPDGGSLSAMTEVPEVAAFARVALQWEGADPGELVSNAPKVLDGQMYRLGEEPQVLHIFSRRLGELTRGGIVRLSMRSDITADNCGADQSARVFRAVPGEPETAYDITLRARDCADVGQSLELKNILQDLKLGPI